MTQLAMTTAAADAKPPFWRKRGFLIIVALVLLARFWGPAKSWADDASSNSWAAWFLATIMDAGRELFSFALSVCLGLIDQAWGIVSPLLPTFWKNVDWSQLIKFLSVANYWFPVQETLVIIAAIYVFAVALVLYRLVKSWLENGW